MKYTREDLAFMKNKHAVQKTSDASMKGKVCVISGASSGVGQQALKQMAEGGADIVMVCRNEEKANLVRGQILAEHAVSIDIVTADFCVLSDVRKAAQIICTKYPVIDVLINSAGVYSTRRKLTQDGFEQVFQVNHLAAFLFTQLLLEPIKKSPQGRIIQVNSEGHRFGGLNMKDLNWDKRHYFGLRAYGASKTAQIMTVMTLADRLKDTNVTINAMHPGAVRTGIGSNNGWLYRTWLHLVIWHTLKDPVISGNALYYLAAAPELSHTSGRYFNLTIDEKPMPHALDETVRQQIWDKSLELTGLTQS